MRLGRDGVIGLICFAVSLALLVQSFSLPQLPLTPVGPGFYPRIVLGLLGMAGLGLLLQDLLAARADGPVSGGEPRPTAGVHRRVILLFGIIAAYVLLLPVLGFRSSTALFVLALQPAIEWPVTARAWAAVVAIAIATPLAAYLVFEKYLLVLLPRGSLTGW
ncbi:MAG: tripartite tricarboxylate transporter TctB family protein [Hyphomicrobiaceae bacterium]|nr:tripartite tricarboxylate transporter TctB family protein [Hyphomicrobiaceae bacterium]